MCVTPAGKIGNCTCGMPQLLPHSGKKAPFYQNKTVSFHFLSLPMLLRRRSGVVKFRICGVVLVLVVVLVLENPDRFAIRLTEQISCRKSVSLRSRNPHAPRTSTTTRTIRISEFGLKKANNPPDRARIRRGETKMASRRATPDRAGARPYLSPFSTRRTAVRDCPGSSLPGLPGQETLEWRSCLSDHNRE